MKYKIMICMMLFTTNCFGHGSSHRCDTNECNHPYSGPLATDALGNEFVLCGTEFYSTVPALFFARSSKEDYQKFEARVVPKVFNKMRCIPR